MASNLYISKCPAAFAEFAAKHNALVDLLLNMTGRNGVEVIATEGNITLEGGGPGGIPAGFTTATFQVCDGGSASTVTFLIQS